MQCVRAALQVIIMIITQLAFSETLEKGFTTRADQLSINVSFIREFKITGLNIMV